MNVPENWLHSEEQVPLRLSENGFPRRKVPSWIQRKKLLQNEILLYNGVDLQT